MSRTSGLVSPVTLLRLVAPVDAREGTGAVTVSPYAEPAVQNRRTLAECVRLALTHSSSIEGAAAASAEATAMRRRARGRFGPVVRVEANVLRRNAAFALPIDIPVPAPLGPLSVPAIPVRDAATAQVPATVEQPLTGLWSVYAWRGSYYTSDAARARARQAEAAQTRAREGLHLEDRQAETEVDTAMAQLRVDRAAVTQAERNLEIVEQRFAHHVGSGTHLLDAQSRLKATRLREVNAGYGVLRAEARWRRGRGLDPVAIEGVSR